MTASVTWSGVFVVWGGAPAAWTVGPAVSRIERILTALAAGLAAGLPEGVRVTRNAALPERIGGQLRLAPGPGPATVIGWDMTAALAMADALGIAPHLVADGLPEIEAVMVRRLNEGSASGRFEGSDA
jgi:hypothetical protein